MIILRIRNVRYPTDDSEIEYNFCRAKVSLAFKFMAIS